MPRITILSLCVSTIRPRVPTLYPLLLLFFHSGSRHRRRRLDLRLLSLLRSLQTPILDQQAKQQAKPHHRRQNNKYRSDSAHIRISDRVEVRRRKRVHRQRIRIVRDARQPRWEVFPQAGLQDLCGNGQADGAAGTAEEVSVGDDGCAVGFGGVGLQGDEAGLEDAAGAEAGDGEDDGDERGVGGAGEGDDEGGAKGPDYEARPDDDAVAFVVGDEDPG